MPGSSGRPPSAPSVPAPSAPILESMSGIRLSRSWVAAEQRRSGDERCGIAPRRLTGRELAKTVFDMALSMALLAVASDGMSVDQWDGNAPPAGIMLRWITNPAIGFPQHGF